MAVVAVHRAMTRPARPRTVSTLVEAVVMLVSWSATIGCSSVGSISATRESWSSACAGVLIAPYTDSAVTSTGAIDRTAKKAIPALRSGSRATTTCRPARRRSSPQLRAGIWPGVTASSAVSRRGVDHRCAA